MKIQNVSITLESPLVSLSQSNPFYFRSDHDSDFSQHMLISPSQLCTLTRKTLYSSLKAQTDITVLLPSLDCLSNLNILFMCLTLPLDNALVKNHIIIFIHVCNQWL